MKIELDPKKSAFKNAADYFEAAKKFKRKAAGALKAMAATKAKGIAAKQAPAGKAKAAKRKWFEDFHSFATSEGLLVVAGKDAKQNELLVAKHLKENDLFFHADVVGAAATILKDGLHASATSKKEAAQWACCYSRAWKAGSGVADAYCVKKDQVSKYSHGEFVGKGAFMIYGEREWFRNTPLALRASFDGRLVMEPALKPGKGVVLVPGGIAKEAVAAELKKRFPQASRDELAFAVPGNASLQ